MAAIRPATGCSASAQPGSMMLRNGSAMPSYSSSAPGCLPKDKNLSGRTIRSCPPPPPLPPARSGPGRGGLAASSGDGRGQPGRVAGRGAVLVVVEIHVHLAVGGPAGRDPVGPGASVAAVARPRLRIALVQPQVAPAGRPPQRRERRSFAVRPAQRRVPRRVSTSRTSSVHQDSCRARPRPGSRRELAQALAQQFRRGPQVRRKLQQHRPEPAAEAGGRRQQPADRLGRVAQPPHVGEVTAGLHGHDEVAGHPLAPGWRRPPARAAGKRCRCSPRWRTAARSARASAAAARRADRRRRASRGTASPKSRPERSPHVTSVPVSSAARQRQISLVYPPAGNANAEPVSRSRKMRVACVHTESITWNDGAP